MFIFILSVLTFADIISEFKILLDLLFKFFLISVCIDLVVENFLTYQLILLFYLLKLTFVEVPVTS